MKNKLNEAFDNVDDKFIEKTEKPPKRSKVWVIAAAAAALAVVVIASFAVGALTQKPAVTVPDDTAEQTGTSENTDQPNKTENGETDEPVTKKAVEPDKKYDPFNGESGNYSGAKYASVADTKNAPVNIYYTVDVKTRSEYNSLCPTLSPIYDKISRLLLDGEKNGVVSPLNIYAALSLLAECTGGNSRAEILSALGMSSIEQLREATKLLWEFNNKNDIYGITKQASSVWLSKSLEFKYECAGLLNTEHYASVFSGDFDDEAYVNSFKQWLSDMTGGLLDESIKDVAVIPEMTTAILASTLYYKSRWNDEFSDMEYGTFKGEKCVFNKKTTKSSVYFGDGFTAYCESLSDGNYMWFFLPDEGKSVSDLIENASLVSYITSDFRTKNTEYCEVTFRMPDFDVSFDETINGAIAKLGINECRIQNKADFSPLSDRKDLYLGEVRHSVRVKVDKDGVEGAALTYEMLAGETPTPPPPYDFTLDRPFVFVVENHGSPLFVGCVNEVN